MAIPQRSVSVMAHYIGGFIKLFGDDLPDGEEFAQLLAERITEALLSTVPEVIEVEIDFEEKA
jgi:hypothetical protein